MAFLKYIIPFYFLITYGFSVYEKVVAWKETKAYYKQHFLNSILPQLMVKPSIVMVIILEVVTIISLLTGFYNLIVFDSLHILTFAMQCSCVLLLVLLIGQRIAKDYVGSTSLTIYFLLNTFCLYLFYL